MPLLYSPANFGASVAFATRHEQGSVLLTSNPIRTRDSPNRPAFEKYMVKHYDSWCSLLETLELDVRPEDLMLITAVDTTQAWSNLVFSERELRGEFRVELPSVASMGGNLGLSVEFSHAESATRDSGPNPEDLCVGDDSDSEPGYVSVPSLSPGKFQSLSNWAAISSGIRSGTRSSRFCSRFTREETHVQGNEDPCER